MTSGVRGPDQIRSNIEQRAKPARQRTYIETDCVHVSAVGRLSVSAPPAEEQVCRDMKSWRKAPGFVVKQATWTRSLAGWSPNW
jgi:hypothetical protein